MLGLMYLNGEGVAKDDAEAARWFRKAAKRGLACGQRNLGVLCLEGRGVRRDPFEARKWLEKAAEQGDATAVRMLDSDGLDKGPRWW
ncbi:TPR repeat protein [Zopfochytrium polystomum]|nr:TPR repeat protein [Zopfochytrium polystomum]